MSEVKTVEQTNGYPPDHDYKAHIKRLEETVSEYVQMYRYWQSEKEQLQKDIKRLNIELSNYAYLIDRAKADRDRAESDNVRLREALQNAIHVIKTLISGDRIVNLDEALAFYKSALSSEVKE